MAAKQKPRTPEQFLCAEGECISREQEEIVRWLRTVKFRKTLLGGVDEVQLWKKLEELYGLYEQAIRAERTRCDALLMAHGVDPHRLAQAPAPGPEGTGPGQAHPPDDKEGC